MRPRWLARSWPMICRRASNDAAMAASYCELPPTRFAPSCYCLIISPPASQDAAQTTAAPLLAPMRADCRGGRGGLPALIKLPHETHCHAPCYSFTSYLLCAMRRATI